MDNISVINKREVTLVQYLVMIYEAEERWASKSSAEQSWFMRQHQLPSEKLLADGVSCIGHPLMPTATAVSLRVRGGSRQGVPDHPVAWLVTVGRHLAIDRLRRSRFESPLADEWDVAGAEPDIGAAAETLHLNDDLLRLLFTCCSPAVILRSVKMGRSPRCCGWCLIFLCQKSPLRY